ncbi:MAG: cytochrome c family protein [Alphaproteobacteria bacterium]
MVAVFLMAGGGGTAQAQSAKPQLHLVPAEACASCHKAIYDQWAASMHARSTPMKDAIHGAFYQALVGDPTQEGVKSKETGGYPDCIQCHAPNAAIDQTTKLDAQPAYAEGVNCVACHTIDAFHGVTGPDGKQRLGTAAYSYSKDSLQGPNGAFNGANLAVAPGGGTDTVPNPFPHRARQSLFKGSEVCLGCHEQRKNAQGVPLCATGPEMRESGTNISCQSCHMPVANGFVNHTMGGGTDPAMLRQATALDLAASRSGEEIAVTVTVRNLLGHRFPTGAPFRYAYVAVTALDAKGGTVWKSFQESPFANDPGAILMLKLVGEDGKPAAPPEATRIAGDSRLKPGESRSLSYKVPAANVAMVRAELRYHLLLPPFVQKFGDKLPPEAKTPTVIARAETTL